MDSGSDKIVADMVITAGKFCYFIENVYQYNLEDVNEFLIKILPVLYIKGALLPEIKEVDEELAERFVTEETWHKIFLSLKEKYADTDSFDMIEPDSTDNKIVTVSISEFISDIYQGLKDFLLLFRKSTTTAQECAIYECRNHFVNRWGIQASIIITELHKLIFKNLKNSSEEDNIM